MFFKTKQKAHALNGITMLNPRCVSRPHTPSVDATVDYSILLRMCRDDSVVQLQNKPNGAEYKQRRWGEVIPAGPKDGASGRKMRKVVARLLNVTIFLKAAITDDNTTNQQLHGGAPSVSTSHANSQELPGWRQRGRRMLQTEVIQKEPRHLSSTQNNLWVLQLYTTILNIDQYSDSSSQYKQRSVCAKILIYTLNYCKSMLEIISIISKLYLLVLKVFTVQ